VREVEVTNEVLYTYIRQTTVGSQIMFSRLMSWQSTVASVVGWRWFVFARIMYGPGQSVPLTLFCPASLPLSQLGQLHCANYGNNLL
jgi:hypothetical protein